MNIAARIRAMDAEGYSRAEISRAVERTPQYVGAVLHKAKRRAYRIKHGLTGKPGRPRKAKGPGELGSGSGA